MSNTDTSAVHATLLVTPSCPHCPAMKQILTALSQQEKLASLEIVDISVDLERAVKLGVRSVPWLQLNALELQGVHTEEEILFWLKQATLKEGRQVLFDSLLEVGQLSQVELMLRRQPEGLSDLLVLFADQERLINVRIGAAAVLETLQGSGLLEKSVEEIGRYTHNTQPSTRIDACHVLSFTHHPSAVLFLKSALNDEDAEVREVARESLEELAEKGFS